MANEFKSGNRKGVPEKGSFYYNSPVHLVLTSPFFSGGSLHASHESDVILEERKTVRAEHDAAARTRRQEAYDARIAENARLRAITNEEEREMKMELSRKMQQKAKAEKAEELRRLRDLVPPGFVRTSDIKVLAKNALNLAINRGYINKRRVGYVWFVEVASVMAYVNRSERIPKEGTVYGKGYVMESVDNSGMYRDDADSFLD